MLLVRDLKKSYGAHPAVDGVSFHAERGETVGLLGPNGAGKTTTVSIIAGLLRGDAGTVTIEGQPIESDSSPVKRRLGLVPQELALYDELTAFANLQLFAALYQLSGAPARKAIGEALATVGLSDRAQDRVASFSGGMKRRLNLAAALLHAPGLLILDEPTTGVDPQSRNAIFDNLQLLRQRGMTLLYTTHYMEEAERLCDRIVIFDHGRVVADDNLEGLYRLLPSTNRLNLSFAHGSPTTTSLSELRDTVHVLQRLQEQGAVVEHLSSESPHLEDVFLHLTGRSLRDE
jgi:ABC-2 type transport system ATP-binding protein